MKVRLGFVSNSSSSSFIVQKKALSEVQMNALKDHINYANENFPQIGWAEKINTWSIGETDEQITLSTGMDNFDMKEFLIAIGIKNENIEWSPYY